MLEFEAFPSWVQEGSTVEDSDLEFNSFARAKFFLEEEQLRPFADFEFPDWIIGRVLVAWDAGSMLINGFVLSGVMDPTWIRLRTNSNSEYDVKYLTDMVATHLEISGDELIFSASERQLTPGGDRFSRIVIAPLNRWEFAAAEAAWSL